MSNYLGVRVDDPQVTSMQLTATPSTVIVAMARLTQTLTPVAVAGATCAEQTFVVPGLLVGDFVDVTPPGITAGVAPVTARVSATNTLAVTFCNATAGSLTPASGSYRIQVMR